MGLLGGPIFQVFLGIVRVDGRGQMVSGCVSIAQLNTNTIFLGGNKLEKDKDLNTAIIKGLFLLPLLFTALHW